MKATAETSRSINTFWSLNAALGVLTAGLWFTLICFGKSYWEEKPWITKPLGHKATQTPTPPQGAVLQKDRGQSLHQTERFKYLGVLFKTERVVDGWMDLGDILSVVVKTAKAKSEALTGLLLFQHLPVVMTYDSWLKIPDERNWN